MPLALTPTTGFFIMVPQDELIELRMTVEEAFTLIISAGIVTPNEHLAVAGRETAQLNPQGSFSRSDPRGETDTESIKGE
jgi:uncharacterized membrane protein